MKKHNESICNLLQGYLTRMLQAEEDILKQLKTVSSVAQSNGLKTIFDKHITETKNQIERLKDCLKYIEKKMPPHEEGLIEKGKNTLKSIAKAAFYQRSDAIDGIIKEGERVFKEYIDTNLHDYVLSSGAQSLEMGEIAAYKTLISLAKECNFNEIQDLLEQTLKEEMKAYDLLTAFSDEEVKKAQKSA